ncbi:MFS transporter [Clostridium sporogenes]|uniref:MFS transporter n=1 Tax=Clostridium sporogenes TaxID=1509 RepID=UPI002149A98C|nr:MFS transporter [Clostridium sporogenes]MCR1974328.1 MFS transporter [Clostridium sporogenes]
MNRDLNLNVDKTEIKLREKKLWNKNFFILWQGQLVSSLGDAIYEIALGFWVLMVTGSTALMGTLMAVSMIPKIVISPFAGVLIDRSERKYIIVAMDLIRGIVITLVGIVTILGYAKIWMILLAGMIIGTCAAFFNPCMGSVLPDIVSQDKIVKANSSYQMTTTGSNLIGTVFGGMLYATLGAPIMFLINGISYLFSAFTELFMKVPMIKKEHQNTNFKEDFILGIKFSWNFKGLRNIIILGCIINFFSQVGFILLMPMFNNDSNLGAAKYGIAMGMLLGGMMIGMVILSIINLKPQNKFKLFCSSGIVCMIALSSIPIAHNFYFICGAIFLGGIFLGGIFNSTLNTLLSSTTQIIVPQHMRGKILSLNNTVCMALSPLGMVLGGVLGGIFEIRKVMFFSFAATLMLIIIFCFMKSVKKVINYDPGNSTFQKIMQQL